MGLLFWKKEKEFKPFVHEKLGAQSVFVRVALGVLIGGLLGECLFWIFEIAVIGINNTQISEEARTAEKAVVLIGMAFGVVASIFKGVTARTKGFEFWNSVANLIIVVYAAIEMASVVKGRLSNQTLQDNARSVVLEQIAAIDSKIKTAESNYETAKKNAVPPPTVEVKKSGWQAIEAERQNQINRNRAEKAREDQKKAGDELNKLRDQRAAIKPPAPTETSILGADFAQWMRISGSALLILMSIVLSRFLGVIIESFGVHRAIKYVKRNDGAVEIKRPDLTPKAPPPEEPKRPVVPTEKPVAPAKVEAGEIPASQRGALAAAAAAAAELISTTASPAFATPTATDSQTSIYQNVVANQQVEGGSGGSSGGGSVKVGVETATIQESVSGSVAAVELPRITYKEFMDSEAARRKLRDAMRSGE